MKHRRKLAPALLLWLFTSVCGQAAAHESQPGLLELEQLTADRYEVLWRAPVYYGRPHPARLVLRRAIPYLAYTWIMWPASKKNVQPSIAGGSMPSWVRIVAICDRCSVA